MKKTQTIQTERKKSSTITIKDIYRKIKKLKTEIKALRSENEQLTKLLQEESSKFSKIIKDTESILNILHSKIKQPPKQEVPLIQSKETLMDIKRPPEKKASVKVNPINRPTIADKRPMTVQGRRGSLNSEENIRNKARERIDSLFDSVHNNLGKLEENLNFTGDPLDNYISSFQRDVQIFIQECDFFKKQFQLYWYQDDKNTHDSKISDIKSLCDSLKQYGVGSYFQTLLNYLSYSLV